MKRLTVLATGSVTASGLPQALRSVRTQWPDLEVNAGLTRSAHRFVTSRSIAMACGATPTVDSWSEDECRPTAEHVEIERWPDAFIVYPASAHFIARLRLGLCDTPFLTALACTRKPIGIAPSVPPGMTDSPSFREHIEALRSWPNAIIAPTRDGVSLTTGRTADGAAGPLTEVVTLVERWFTAADGERLLTGMEPDWSERGR